MQCPNCQSAVGPGDRFCEHCGKPLASPMPAPRDGAGAAPPPAVPRDPSALELTQGEFRRLLSLVHYAMGTADRPALNGVRMEIEPDRLTFVAADGHRLAIASRAMSCAHAGRHGVTLPRAAVAQLMDLLTRPGEPVTIAVSEQEATVRFSGKTMKSQFVRSAFPDYRRAIPAGNANVARVDRARLAQVLRGMRSANGQASRSIWAFGSGKLAIDGADSGRIAAPAELEAEYRGAALRIGLDARFVLDIVSSLDSDQIELALGDAGTPVLLTVPQQDEFKGIVMPMKI
jgi:DNA polymerase-3 subunit beta